VQLKCILCDWKEKKQWDEVEMEKQFENPGLIL
jgi:hypothetical protein